MFGIQWLSNAFFVFLIGALPILEIRGAVITGIGLGMPWQEAYILGLMGNLFPVPFLLLLLKPMFKHARKIRPLRKFSNLVIKKAIKQIRKNPSIVKYTIIGLTLFVAVPLPGTGVWTGAVIAAILDMKPIHALLALCIGAAIAGVIVLTSTLGVVRFIA